MVTEPRTWTNWDGGGRRVGGLEWVGKGKKKKEGEGEGEGGREERRGGDETDFFGRMVSLLLILGLSKTSPWHLIF